MIHRYATLVCWKWSAGMPQACEGGSFTCRFIVGYECPLLKPNGVPWQCEHLLPWDEKDWKSPPSGLNMKNTSLPTLSFYFVDNSSCSPLASLWQKPFWEFFARLSIVKPVALAPSTRSEIWLRQLTKGGSWNIQMHNFRASLCFCQSFLYASGILTCCQDCIENIGG